MSKEKKSCGNCRHEAVCEILGEMQLQLYDEAVLSGPISELASKFEKGEGRTAEEIHLEVDRAIRQAFAKVCPHYSRKHDGEKITVKDLRDSLETIKVDVPEGVLKALNQTGRSEVLTYATEEMFFQEDSEKYERPTYVPAVLLPYLAMGAAKAADPERHASHEPGGE